MKQRLLVLLSAFICFTHANVLAQQNEVSYMHAGGKLRPLQALMDIRHYTLNLTVDIPNKAIDGYTEIDLMLSKPADTLLFDLFHKYTVHSIAVDGKSNAFSKTGDSLLITRVTAFKAGKHKIKINYGGKPPIAVRPPWEGGFTWAKDSLGNDWVAINDQLQGAKILFPCKDHPSDEPNEGADLFITIPKDLSVAGPGLLQGVKAQKGDKATWHWKTNYTISNYCILFNIGKYKVVTRPYTTVDGNTVPIQFYVLEEDVAHAAKVLDIRARDTKILEKYFGEYPWVKEKIGIAEVPNSGMEHQTMVTYGDKFKYMKYATLDYSPNLLHEFAHEWWANKITNRDWAHMWIQEGIATYAEALFHKEALGEAAYDSVMLDIRPWIRNEKPVVQGEGLDMGQVYNGDIYLKGAFFMHTLRGVLGDSVFFPALKKFVSRVKYPYNEFFVTDDVANFFSAEAGKDLKPLFDFYLLTTKKLEIEVVKTRPDNYIVTVINSPMPLPLDILTDSGITHITITSDAKNKMVVKSKTQPVIDPKGWYFKKVSFE